MILAFQVPFRGGVAALTATVLVGGFGFSGLGLLVASRAQTIQGVSGLMNAAMLPMWLLSGVFFSADRFPGVMQPFIRALPLTAANDALRALTNEGAGFAGVIPAVLLLMAWGVGCFGVGLRLFRWD